jgi:hypothetical protein
LDKNVHNIAPLVTLNSGHPFETHLRLVDQVFDAVVDSLKVKEESKTFINHGGKIEGTGCAVVDR